jgi:nucleotide sugar dehydrogenase
VDAESTPDLSALLAACGATVEFARTGQRIILATTSYVGTTRDLLINPLAARGLHAGSDIYVGFSPERIDPGTAHTQAATPRVLGAATDACFEALAPLVAALSASVHRVDSPEMAEFSKLYENIYRAVNVALANEMADIARSLGLSPMDALAAAATKPFGFAPFTPGPGVGGHCIPCDPHYLLWQLHPGSIAAPLIEQAMAAIAARPAAVVARAVELLESHGTPLAKARILLAGVAYKPGVADTRASPALEIMAALEAMGAHVAYFDPRVPACRAADGAVRHSEASLAPASFELAIAHTAQPEIDLAALTAAPLVLDATYRVPAAPNVFQL